MRVFADTNILFDVFLERGEFYDNSAQIWSLAERKIAEVFISAISFNNVFYTMRKIADAENAQRAVEAMNANFVTIPLTQDIITKAIVTKLPDFEDALQLFSAVIAECDVIVTRNIKHFPQDGISIMSPATFLAKHFTNYRQSSKLT